MNERNCETCEFYKDSGRGYRSCSKWQGVQDGEQNNEPDFDCALKD
jgi:hypothetical protein